MNWFERLKVITKKEETSQNLDEELQFHIDKQIEENIANGMTPTEARRAARLEFGGVESLKEECRSARGMDWLENLWQDLRYASRNFRRRPGFALAVIAITAAGIGSTTAVFSFVDRVLFRGLPYAETERLISFGVRIPWFEYDFLPARGYNLLRNEPKPLLAVTATAGVVDCDLMGSQPVRVGCANVESTFLPMLGVRPFLGRNFALEEDRPGVPRVGLISYSMWQSHFGSQREIVGRRIVVDDQPMLIVGVLPPEFEMPTLERTDLLMPLALPADVPGGGRPLRIYGKMVAGASAKQVGEMLDGRREDLLTAFPPDARKTLRFNIKSLRDVQSGDFHAASWTLLGAVLAMLLIACANAANLFIARAAACRRELAIRVALGAGRARMMRQSLTESLLLSLLGGAGGCVLAHALLRWFVLLAPSGIPHLSGATLDLRVLAFGLCAALFSGLLFGVAPLRATPRTEMLTGTRATGSTSTRSRSMLVAGQLAMSLVLLTCAGALLQSLWKRQSLTLGVSTERIVTAQFVLGQRYDQPAARAAFYERLEERLAMFPGADSVAMSDSLPPGGVPRSQPLFAPRVEGKPPLDGVSGIVVWRAITPSYFSTLGIPIVRGRAFNEEDRRPGARSIMISASYARLLFGNEDPLGHRMARYPVSGRNPDDWFTIVGVAADARNAGLSDHVDPEYYLVRRRGTTSLDDLPAGTAVIARGSAGRASMESWLRREIAAVDPAIPPVIRAMDEHIGTLAIRPRFQATLLALFAAMGLLLAAFGLFGLVSFLVTQREREFGVRLALGATPREIVGMIMRQTFSWAARGLAAGLIGSVIATIALRGMLFGVSPADPRTYAAAILVLVTVMLLSAFLPSRRAARLDPAATLRQD